MASIVVIGTSRGGVIALRTLLGWIRPTFPLPLVIVLHRSRIPEGTLTASLQAVSRLPVKEPEDKTKISPATVYLAPSNYHLLIEGDHFALSTEAPVKYARPSIDVTLETAAESVDGGVVAVILTGASNDGLEGCRAVKAAGGIVIAQDPATAEATTLPDSVIGAGLADRVLSIDEIAIFLNLEATKVLSYRHKPVV